MYKSLLLKFPWFYEQVQSLRDSIAHNAGLKNGSFSQHGEDVQILRLLKEANARGPYVDIGCNHPFRISNTYLLYLNGWRGICIDPLPRFAAMYGKWRVKDIFECSGISDQSGEMTLFEFESDVLSTLDQDLADQYQRNGYKFRRKLQTKVQTIDAVLEARGLEAPISLLSIDIEGRELSALKSISLAKWEPLFICLEALTADGKRNEDSIQYLCNNGYSIASDLGLNLLFSRD